MKNGLLYGLERSIKFRLNSKNNTLKIKKLKSKQLYKLKNTYPKRATSSIVNDGLHP